MFGSKSNPNVKNEDLQDKTWKKIIFKYRFHDEMHNPRDSLKWNVVSFLFF